MKMVIKPSHVSGPSYRSWGLLLAPREDQVPGKTGLHDEAVIFDTDPDVLPTLARLVAGRAGHEKLWPMSPKEDIETFNKCAKRLGLDRLGVARYSLRHGGASDDILTKRRGLKDAMKCGRWRTDQSLRRYAKGVSPGRNQQGGSSRDGLRRPRCPAPGRPVGRPLSSPVSENASRATAHVTASAQHTRRLLQRACSQAISLLQTSRSLFDRS